MITQQRDSLAQPGPAADEAARVRLAARASTPASVLRTLAADPAVTVRAAVAMNPTYAPAADKRLLDDADERVRTLLAGKILRLLPGLPGQDQSEAQAHVHAVLMSLANDAASRVRQAIADAIASTVDAPRELVLVLARDPVLSVSDPVVRFSPQLTDADLMELLATPPHDNTAVAVADRQGLSALVADEIAAHADGAAVRALLANRSATIQEATLDALVGRAGDHPEWHEPLVCRPALPVRAMRALSRMVAGHLLDMLARRPDVSPALAEQLRERVRERLDGPMPPSEAAVLDGVRRLDASGALNEVALMEAVTAGEPRQAAAILAVCGGVSLSSIDRAVGLRSAKVLVSLVARAGFSMQAAVAIQGLLGRLAPGEVMQPTTDGGYPMTRAEMEWQIELLAQPGR